MKEDLSSASRLALGGKRTNKNGTNGHLGQRKGLKNQLGHIELEENDPGPNKD